MIQKILLVLLLVVLIVGLILVGKDKFSANFSLNFSVSKNEGNINQGNIKKENVATSKGDFEESSNILRFGECLTKKGVIFYGTERCPHCKDQKKLFGDDIIRVNYVDCDKNKGLCEAAGLKGYPTWKFADGSQLMGIQSLKTLAKKTDCVLY